MRRQFENPQDDNKGDELPPPDEEEEDRLTPEQMEQAQAYSFDSKTFYLTATGHMFNEQGKAVTSSRRRQILTEGQLMKKAA
ncbi:MAG: hypothetical protein PHC53_01030 [Patescibacteria group bacterium]|nr:hypothetical protein [Patescibacteria group bacterium]